MKTQTLWFLVVVAIFLAFVSDAETAYASSGGSGLPFTAPLVKLREAFTGEVAFSIAVLAFVGCGATLIFGNEINGVIRGALVVVLCGALMVSAQNVASALFGQGATIEAAGALPVDHAEAEATK